MSVVVDIFVWLFIETFLGFIVYSTGCLILKVVTFGQYKIEFKDFTSFKSSKSKKVDLVFLLGMTFYVTLILLVAYLIN
ncbi:hypothetical protein PSECIP111951_02036 [Pseudoalteromonas holothuriae]|uniref:Uncharacterized protein n=1 Tax=Pseudoalteromonas holothuriae TaxID=2963714 RepID=A0A9W4QV67_9GAMM|nr:MULTISPECIES: hypothetical protein [unclassified Pseudoalteromonas]CAH9054661.1 hypothetical protein PSECIP111854_01419 [Pseudoalteromonas sp. CIP111854]CAH9059251.1 hypothetical protein PSECIP111951_02036 [Pseudoalteromonas sp. CIP111951]